MNLLYLIIIIPLLSFLLQIVIGRHTRIENIIVIGISTIVLVCLLNVFVIIDYSANSIPDTSLIYSRYLWEWLSIGDFKVDIVFSLDGLSLVFICLISLLSLLIYSFTAFYLTDSDDIYTFFAYGNLLIVSLFWVVLADNLFVLMVGWEGVSISSYLLLAIYYKKSRVSLAAVKSFIIFSIVDLFFLIGVFLIYSELDTLVIRDILMLAEQNLAIDSEIIFWITTMLFIGILGKAGLFPFHNWFSETAVSSFPVMLLLQTCSAAVPICYFMLRMNQFFAMSTDIFIMMGIFAGLTIIFASCISLVQNDIKRLVSYINLVQLSYLFLAFTSQNWDLSIDYLFSYVISTSLLLMSSALLVQSCNRERDIHKLGGLYSHLPIIYIGFLGAAASISTMPWIVSTFYSKGGIILGLMENDRMGVGALALIGLLLSTLSVLRLLFIVFHHKQKLTHLASVSKITYIPLFIFMGLLFIMSISFSFPMQGIVSSLGLNGSNQLSFQLLLAAVTILGILIAYILFFHSSIEVHEIVNTPIGKTFHRIWSNEWRFDRVTQMVIVRPYLYITQVIKKDPLAQWINWIVWGVRKINFQFLPIENGRLRWYLMSIVAGSIVILSLLVLV